MSCPIRLIFPQILFEIKQFGFDTSLLSFYFLLGITIVSIGKHTVVHISFTHDVSGIEMLLEELVKGNAFRLILRLNNELLFYYLSYVFLLMQTIISGYAIKLNNKINF